MAFSAYCHAGYFFSAGTGAGATGAAGGAAGIDWAGGVAGATWSGMMLLLPPPRPQKIDRAMLVSMKMMAAPVVSLLMKVLPPPAPNTDWLPLAPKDAPISAPLPDCSRTIMITELTALQVEMLRHQIVGVYEAAFTGPPYFKSAREASDFGGWLPQHVLRPNFRFVAAFDDESGRVVGFAGESVPLNLF